jgi:cytoskeletal protein RodZ
MTDNQHKIQSDALDQQLDAALSSYAAVEPRTGLEQRILASLRAQREHAPARGWWRWAAAGALAVVIILVPSLSWRARKPQLVKAPDPVTQQHVGDAQIASNPALPPRPAASVRTVVTNRTPHSSQAATAAPRWSHFPSPEAMSDQEKMLADYAAEFQEQAVLIARFNEEDLRRDRMELVENAQNPNSTRLENEETKLR